MAEEIKEFVIKNLESNAYWHWKVAAMTLGSACIVAIAGSACLMWLFPLKIMPALVKCFSPDNSKPSDIVTLLMNGPLALSFAVISYLAHLLVSVYRYNISLYGHYATRAEALRLIQTDQLSLEMVIKCLDPGIIKFEVLQAMLK